MTFVLKTYDVQVQGLWQVHQYLGRTPAQARARAWEAYSSFNAISFRNFLKISTIRRGENDARLGKPITVGGLPAFWCGHNGQYVRFCRPGSDVVLLSHPNDVSEGAP